jgi:hypothetical protein
MIGSEPLAIFVALHLLVSSEEYRIGSEKHSNCDLQVGSVWSANKGEVLAIFVALNLQVSSEEPWIGNEKIPNFDLQTGPVQWTT